LKLGRSRKMMLQTGKPRSIPVSFLCTPRNVNLQVLAFTVDLK
jgi:hypothetical protein